jgi:type I restriction enzyme, S subunit
LGGSDLNKYLPEVPNGWVWASLAEIAAIKGGLTKGKKRKPTDALRQVSYLRVANVQRGFLNLEKVHLIEATEDEIEELRLIPGDVLFTEGGDRDKLGRGWIWSGELIECIHQNHVFRARLYLVDLQPKLISWYGNTYGQKYFLGEGKQTTNLASINLTKLASFPIALPPLNEQRRIVAKIEALKARSQRVKEELEDIPQLLDQFRQSVLAAAFRGDLTADWREQNPDVEPASVLLDRIYEKYNNQYQEDCSKAKATGNRKPKKPDCLIEYNLAWEEVFKIPQTWLVRPLGKVCTKVTDGTHDTPKTVSQGIPYITAQHIRNGFIDFENCFFIPESEHKIIYSRCNPEKGDVIIVNIGAGTATPALVNRDFEFSMKNIALLKPITEVVDGKYLEYYQLAIKPNIFSRVSRGGAQPFMSLNLIKTIPFKLSPLSEQKEIVKRVELLLNLADNIEQQYQEAKANIDQLDQSILAKAFRGELVPQDPDDEPASILLERIRAERAKLQTKTAKKSTLQLGSVTTTKTSARRTKKTQPQQEESVQLDLGLE